MILQNYRIKITFEAHFSVKWFSLTGINGQVSNEGFVAKHNFEIPTQEFPLTQF